MDRDDHDVARPLGRTQPGRDPGRGGVRRFGDEVDPAAPCRGGPAARYAAGGHPHGEDQDASAAGDGDDRGTPGLVGVPPRSWRAKTRVRQRVEGLLQPAAAVVQHMVVGQGAGVRTGGGQAGQVGRVHPVVDLFAGRGLVVPRDGGLQVEDPDVGRRRGEHVQRVAPGPGEVGRSGNPAVRRLGQLHIGAGILDVRLPQLRIAGVRKDLVDSPAEHHIAGQEQRDEVTTHASRLGRSGGYCCRTARGPPGAPAVLLPWALGALAFAPALALAPVARDRGDPLDEVARVVVRAVPGVPVVRGVDVVAEVLQAGG